MQWKCWWKNGKGCIGKKLSKRWWCGLGLSSDHRACNGTCAPSTELVECVWWCAQEVEAGGSDAQNHPWACAMARCVKASAAKPHALIPGAHMIKDEN